jgi:hypothetical protein
VAEQAVLEIESLPGNACKLHKELPRDRNTVAVFTDR